MNVVLNASTVRRRRALGQDVWGWEREWGGVLRRAHTARSLTG